MTAGTNSPPRPTHQADSRRAARDAGPPSRWQQFGLPVLGVVVTVAVWQAAVRLFNVRTFFLPAPTDIVAAMRRYPELLLAEAWVTVYETLAGFAIGASSGLLLATTLAAMPTLERALLPLIVALNAIPVVALAPLLILWLGLGAAPRITLAALICFFPIMIAAMAGLNSTPAELGDLARSLTASRWRTFVKVRVPWALPQVFVGLRVGMTLAVIGAVVAQMARPSAGLGSVILRSGQTANTPLAFASIVLLMVISISLFYSVFAAERLLLPWARETATARR